MNENDNFLINKNNENSLIEVINNFFTDLSEKGEFETNILYNTNNSFSSPPILIKDNIQNKKIELKKLFYLTKSENEFINKLIQTFCILYYQIDRILDDNKVLYSLLLYGELNATRNSMKFEEGESDIFISNMLPVFDFLQNKIFKLFYLSKNILEQLLILYHCKSEYYLESFKKNCGIYLYKPLIYLCKIFSFLNMIDIIIEKNEFLSDHYKRYIINISKNQNNFNFQSEDYKKYSKCINLLKEYLSTIISGNLLQNFIKELLENCKIEENEIFKDYVYEFMNYNIKQIENEKELNENNLIELYSFLPFLKELNIRKKYYENVYLSLYKIQEQIFLIPLFSTGVNFIIEDFMKKLRYENNYDNSNIDYYKKPQNINQTSQYLYNQFLESFKSNCSENKNNILEWIEILQSDIFDLNFSGNENTKEYFKYLNQIISILFKGLNYLKTIKNELIKFFTESSYLNKEINEKLIPIILTYLELISMIKNIFIEKKNKIINLKNNLEKLLLSSLYLHFEDIEKKLLPYNYEKYIQDFLGCTSIIKTILKDGEMNYMKLQILLQSYDICKFYISYYYNSIHIDIIDSFEKIDIFLNFSNLIYQYSSNNFIYWYKSIIPVLFKYILKKIKKKFNFILICKSIGNSANMLLYNRHYILNNQYIELYNSYKKYIINCIEENYLKPLSQNIEINIRILINEINLNIISEKTDKDILLLESLNRFLSIPKFEIFQNEYINIKEYVTNYLNKLFYEMNAINVNDWKIYQQMKLLLDIKFNIHLNKIETFLPIKHIEQQIDLIYIVENIYSFINSYHYNFNENIFIEDMNNNHISNSNIIKEENIIYSLNTHGIGIINSIINKLYQIISLHLKNILEIAVDDYIKFLLISEEKNWINRINKGENYFSIEKSSQILSENENIISELYSEIKYIGNIISLIRMIKTALMKYSEILFIYNDSSKLNNLNLIKSENEQIQKTFYPNNILYNNIVSTIKEITNKNFLLLMVNSFEGVFDKFLNDLKYFSFIIPSITLYHIKQILLSKQNLSRKILREGEKGYFCDDGFIFGLVYLIKIFKIEKNFESIHWLTKRQEVKDEKSIFLNLKEIYFELNYITLIYETTTILFEK